MERQLAEPGDPEAQQDPGPEQLRPPSRHQGEQEPREDCPGRIRQVPGGQRRAGDSQAEGHSQGPQCFGGQGGDQERQQRQQWQFDQHKLKRRAQSGDQEAGPGLRGPQPGGERREQGVQGGRGQHQPRGPGHQHQIL